MTDAAELLSRPPEEGARLLALGFLGQAAAARPRLEDPADTEALHDFRVALRRLRSSLRAYRPFLGKSLPKKLGRRLRDLAGLTGPGRDTEVQIEWLRGRSRHLSSHHRAGLSWLLTRLEERMRSAYGEVLERVPEDFPKIEEELRRRLSVYRTEVHLGTGPERPTLADATAEILRRQAAELREQLSQVESPSQEEECHEARISAKRLRYLLDPFTAALPGAVPMVKHLKGLQDLLGELHDAHVLEAELKETIETAAADRARRLFDLSLAEPQDEALLRPLLRPLLRQERRRPNEPGLLALARLNRNRRDRLFASLEAAWLHDRNEAFFGEIAAVGEEIASAGRGLVSPHNPGP